MRNATSPGTPLQIDDGTERSQKHSDTRKLLFTPWIVAAFSLTVACQICLAGEEPNSQSYTGARFEFDPERLLLHDEGEYTRIEYPDAIYDPVEEHRGRPRLPISGQWFILPDETKISSVTVSVEWDTIPGRYVLRDLSRTSRTGPAGRRRG